MYQLFILILSAFIGLSSSGFALTAPQLNDELTQIDATLEKELELSQEQQQKILQLKQQLQGRRSSVQDQLKLVNMKINQQIQNTLRDDRKLATLLAQKRQLLGIMVNNNKVYKQQYFNMLTPKQKVTFTHKTQPLNPSTKTTTTSKSH